MNHLATTSNSLQKSLAIWTKPMKEKPVPSYATNKYRKRPRERAQWSILRYWEIERGYPTGHIGNRVWVDSLDHSKGFYELDAEGNETGWFQNQE